MLDIEKQTMTPQNKASSFSGFNWDFQLVLVCFIKAVARGGGGATGACAPPLKKTTTKNYIRFYTNNPKCQYVYLSFYLNDYQIIDKVNTI